LRLDPSRLARLALAAPYQPIARAARRGSAPP
jgi:hypothetical protein